jgi:hypothetical protein
MADRMDQETRKISAAQLAEVLAKVDHRGAKEGRVSEVGPSPAASNATSKPTPAPAPAPAGSGPPAASDAPPPSEAPPASAPPQVLAVVERPVGKSNVVNATSPDAPSSSGHMPVAGDSEPPETSSARKIVAPSPIESRESRDAEADARKIVDAGRSTMMGALLVVAVFVVGCVVLVLVNQ